MSEIRKGSVLRLSVTDLNNLGAGVARAEDGRVVFVRGAVSGDEITAEIIKVTRDFLVGRLLSMETPSPHREEGFCGAPNACGGCVYRHVTYAHELELKREYVTHAFRKAGLPDVTVLPVRSTGKTEGYRNKAQYPVAKTKEGIRAGFYAAKSHHLIAAEDCRIQNEAFSAIVKEVCAFAEQAGWTIYDEETGTGLLRHIYLRIGEKTGQILLCLVVNGDRLPNSEDFVIAMREESPAISGILLNINKEKTNVVLGKRNVLLWGRDFMEDELCGLRFRVSPDSFYQVNRDGAELLYGLAAKEAELCGNEVLMDLYCGTGTIGLSMAKKVKRLSGVEIVPAAVECARENARRNGIDNAEFFCDDAGSAEVILRAAGGTRPDVVILDPPRKGSTRELVRTLSSLGVPKVVYVSCDPDTLARDCRWFSVEGYEIGQVQPVDMFPRTGHVESVVLLTKF